MTRLKMTPKRGELVNVLALPTDPDAEREMIEELERRGESEDSTKG